jgi:hypothetical protein
MRNTYDNNGRAQPGDGKMRHVFDSTLMVSTMRFASRLQSELMPPFQRWAKLIPGAFIPQERRGEVAKKLDSLTETLFTAISTSNFDVSIAEFLLDLAVGTGCMMVIPGDDEMPVRYVAVPQAQCALEEGAWGGVCAVYRIHEVAIGNIEETWAAFKVDMPSGLEKDIADDPTKTVRITEATYYDYQQDNWHYDVMLEYKTQGASKKQPHRLVEHDFIDTPWVITRWIKLPGEVEGRGPVLFALPDAKTLNKLKELVLMNASIAVSGVWTAVDDGVLNPYTIRITPGAVIPVGSNGGALGPSLQALETGANFSVADILADDLIMSIKTIMMDGTLPPEEGSVRSATEIVARLKQLQQDIGAPFGRLMSELIRPVVQITLNTLAQAGIIPIERGRKIKVNGGTIDVQIQSPLAQAQNLNDVQAATNWLAILKEMGEEAFLIGCNVEDAGEWFAEKMGVDRRIVRDQQQREGLQRMVGSIIANQQGGAIPANDGGGALQAAA